MKRFYAQAFQKVSSLLKDLKAGQEDNSLKMPFFNQYDKAELKN